jgi:hypothetical protein
VIVSLALPLQIVHAQSVQQHDHPAAGLRDRRGQRGSLARQRDTVPTQHIVIANALFDAAR